MKLATAKVLELVAGDADVNCKVREEYCGRGMVASTTAAVTVDSYVDLLHLVALAAVVVDGEGDYVGDFPADVRRFRFDSFGHGIVVY